MNLLGRVADGSNPWKPCKIPPPIALTLAKLWRNHTAILVSFLGTSLHLEVEIGPWKRGCMDNIEIEAILQILSQSAAVSRKIVRNRSFPKQRVLFSVLHCYFVWTVLSLFVDNRTPKGKKYLFDNEGNEQGMCGKWKLVVDLFHASRKGLI